jgi:hypothetical protein
VALARCEKCGRPNGNSGRYVEYRNPASHPSNPIVCSARGCERPGKIWLTVDEQNQYLNGQRVFPLAANAAKVRVL